MPAILFVKPDPDHKRVQIGIGDGASVEVLTVKEDTYKSFDSLTKGDLVSEHTVDTLRFEDEVYRAVKKALGYISDMDRSAYALKLKLLRLGFSSEAVEMAIARCSELGYINEDDQLDRLVEREANLKLKGKYYIKRKFASKGYSIASVDRAINRLVDRQEIDFDDCFERLAEKRGATTEEERKALQYRYGYKI